MNTPEDPDGFVFVIVLIIVLATTGLGMVGLTLALAETRIATAVRSRIASDLLASGEAARVMTRPVSSDSGSTTVFPSTSSASGKSRSQISWLTNELALVWSWGRAAGAPVERGIGFPAWILDPAVHLASPIPTIGVGGRIGLPPGFVVEDDSCGGQFAPGPRVGPNPLRWTAPLDFAVGWRGPRAPSPSEVAALAGLAVPTGLVLRDRPLALVSDSVGPVVLVASGGVRLAPGALVSGLLIVSGDLVVEAGAVFAGVTRVLGDITVQPGARIVASRCTAEAAFHATGWTSSLWSLHGYRGRIRL